MRAAALLILFAAAALQPSSTSDAFDLAALRRDGVIVPFATFNGRRWSARWPAPDADPTIPVNIASVPAKWWGGDWPHDAWTLSLASGSERIAHVKQPDVFDAFCYRQIGLRTDYESEALPPPPFVRPYPKDGLASSPARAVEAIDVVPVEGPDARAINNLLFEQFNRAEAETINGREHPVKKADRNAQVPAIEAMYAYGAEPRVYYVEASRSYRTVPTACSIAFGTGWFVREHGSFRVLTMVVDELDCERHGASFMLPLGVVRAAGRAFWIVQFSGADHERFAIIEPKTRSVDAVLSVWEGGC